MSYATLATPLATSTTSLAPPLLVSDASAATSILLPSSSCTSTTSLYLSRSLVVVVVEAMEEAPPGEDLQVAPEAGDEGVEGGAPLLALLHLHLHLLHLARLQHLPGKECTLVDKIDNLH